MGHPGFRPRHFQSSLPDHAGAAGAAAESASSLGAGTIATRTGRAPEHLAFRAAGGELFVIGIVNLFLTLVTLGIYYPWGRARVLRYMIGGIECDGDRFSFHGTGRELFLGMLRVWLFFIIPMIALAVVTYLPTVPTEIRAIASILTWAGVIVLAAFATIGSYRYRVNRTSWRGIRFSFRGPGREYAREFMLRSLLNIVTLGLAYPRFATWRRHFLIHHTRFGTMEFGFDGEARDLYRRFIIALLLTIPTLGLSWAWYHGEQQQYFWSRTTVGGSRFRCDVTGMGWLGMQLAYALMAMLTLGLAMSWIQVGNLRYLFERLSLDAPLDLERTRQDALAASATGEELADFFDSDGGIDVG